MPLALVTLEHSFCKETVWLQAFDSTVNLRALEGHPSQNLGLCFAGWVDPLYTATPSESWCHVGMAQ